MVDHWSPNPNFEGPAQYAYSPHNNFEDFFQTGYNIANTLTLTSGTEKIRTLFSYTNTIAEGIVETNKLLRNNFNVRIDGNLHPKLYFDAKLTYVRQKTNNRLDTGDSFSNPMRSIAIVHLRAAGSTITSANGPRNFSTILLPTEKYASRTCSATS